MNRYCDEQTLTRFGPTTLKQAGCPDALDASIIATAAVPFVAVTVSFFGQGKLPCVYR